MHIQTMNSL